MVIAIAEYIKDYGILVLSCAFISTITWVILYNIRRAKGKSTIIGLRVEEKDIDHDQRYVLIAVSKDGSENIMNSDRAMTIEEMEIYFQQEMEKLCTK